MDNIELKRHRIERMQELTLHIISAIQNLDKPEHTEFYRGLFEWASEVVLNHGGVLPRDHAFIYEEVYVAVNNDDYDGAQRIVRYFFGKTLQQLNETGEDHDQ